MMKKWKISGLVAVLVVFVTNFGAYAYMLRTNSVSFDTVQSVDSVKNKTAYYDSIKKALENFQDGLQVSVQNYKNDYNLDAVKQVLVQNPLLDYGFSGSEIKVTKGKAASDRLVQLTLHYSVSVQQMQQKKEKAEKRATDVLKASLKPGMDGLQIERAVYRKMIQYDNSYSKVEDSAKEFYRSLNLAGVECQLVSGTVGGGSRLWNLVRINGSYYHVDPSYDLANYTNTRKLNYSYFNLTDGDIKKDHQWSEALYPACPSYNSLGQTIVIKDAYLEKAVRDTIDKPSGDLQTSDVENMDTLSYFALNHHYIKDLEGIQYLKNLKNLYLTGAEITDYHLLKTLDKLESLALIFNGVKPGAIAISGEAQNDFSMDISEICKLPHIKKLTLSQDRIKDLSPLGQLKNLEYLDLSADNYFMLDYSVLKSFPTLQTLCLINSGIKDLSPLSGLTELKELQLGANGLSDLTPLRSLQKLEILDVSNNAISDISVIQNMPKLTTLHINDNHIEDFSALSGLKNLGELNLLKNSSQNYSALKPIYGKLTVKDFSDSSLETISAPYVVNAIPDQSLMLGGTLTIDLAKVFGDDDAEKSGFHYEYRPNIGEMDGTVLQYKPERAGHINFSASYVKTKKDSTSEWSATVRFDLTVQAADQPAISAIGFQQNNGGTGYMAGGYDGKAIMPMEFNNSQQSQYAAIKNPRSKWEFTVDNSGDLNNPVHFASTPVIDREGNIYVSDASISTAVKPYYYTYSLDASGKLRYDIDLNRNYYSSVIGADGTLYTANSALFAYSASGVREWVKSLDVGVTSAVALDSKGNLLVSEYFDLRLFDKYGNDLWSYKSDDTADFVTPILSDNGYVYAVARFRKIDNYLTNKSTFLVLEASTGKLVYRKDLDFADANPVAAGKGDKVYIPGNGKLLIFNAKTMGMTEINRGKGQYLTPAITKEGRIVAVDSANDLESFDQNGNLLWTAKLGEEGLDIPTGPTVTADGYIYVILGSKLFCYDQNGALVWLYQLSSNFEPGGRVVVGESGEIVIAGSLIDNPSPFEHLYQKTGIYVLQGDPMQ